MAISMLAVIFILLQLRPIEVLSKEQPATNGFATFQVIWNVPSRRCHERYKVPFNLTAYNIAHNKQEDFMGEQITLFYHNALGTYPYVKHKKLPKKNITVEHVVNGGIPQNVNLTKHLEKVKKDIAKRIPNPDYSGLAVIDWEGWWPLWKLNWGTRRIYRKLSVDFARLRHPNWIKRRLRCYAKKKFRIYARRFMVKTLRVVKELRPLAKWGFYGYPKCFHRGSEFCVKLSQTANDRLHWLYEESTGLFPSVYLKLDTKDHFHSNHHLYVQARLLEAIRIRNSLRAPIPVYAYSKLSYDTYMPKIPLYNDSDLCSTIKQPSQLGLSGVIIWSSSASVAIRSKCQAIAAYLNSTLGPYAKRQIASAKSCSDDTCRGRGRCVFEPQPWCDFNSGERLYNPDFESSEINSVKVTLKESNEHKSATSNSFEEGTSFEKLLPRCECEAQGMGLGCDDGANYLDLLSFLSRTK